MNRIILFVSCLLLTYVNSHAGNILGENPAALVADFTVSATSGCAPLEVQFTSTSTSDPGDPIISYTWDFGDGTPVTVTNPTISHTYNIAGTQQYFTVKLTITTQSSATETTTKSDYIRAFEKLIPDLGPDTTICSGTNFLLDPNLPYAADTYIWNNPDWNVSGGYPAVNVQHTGEYWVEVAHGTCTARDTIVISEQPTVYAHFDYTVVDNCGSMTVQFNNLSASCSGNPLSYIWNIYDMDSELMAEYYGANPTHTFDEEGDYYVLLFADEGDNSWSAYELETVNVTFSPGPSPVTMTGPLEICEGGSVQLDAGYEPGATYLWSPATGLNDATIYNPEASPSTNTTYTVTKTKCGNDVTGSVTVNVTPPFTVDLGPDQTMCPGGSLTLDAGDHGSGASYQWGSTYNPVYSTKTTRTVLALGAGKYWVTVTKNSCSVTDTILIIEKPAVEPMFNSVQTNFCSPLNIDFTDASVVCSGSITNYEWDFGDGTPAESGFIPTISHGYATAGTYHVRLKVTNNSGSSDTFEKDILVTGNTKPVVNLGAAASICAGGSITIDAGAHGAGATYAWSTGETSQTITVSPTANATYTVDVTKDGCTGSGSKAITVNTTPLVVDLGPDQSMCSGESLTLDAGDHGPGTTYKWGSTFDPIYSIQKSRTVHALGAGKYWVTVKKDGCEASDTIIITKKPEVQPMFSYTQSGVCNPIEVTFTSESEVCGSVKDYTWDFGDGSPVVSGFYSTTSHIYTDGGLYSVKLTITNNANISETHEEQVLVSGTAVSVKLGNDTTICTGSSIVLDAGDFPGATYEWMPNGETTRTITVASEDTYMVTVKSGGCTGTGMIKVTVVPELTVDLGKDTTICAGSSVILDAGNLGATYVWSTGETTRTISAGVAGEYSVVVNKGTCSGSGSIKIDVNTTIPVFLGNDTAICTGSSIILNAGYPGATYSWSTTATSQTIPVSAAGIYKVTVDNNGCVGEDEIEISLKTAAEPVNLGNDTTVCFGNSVKLDAGNPGATYLWSTGETSQIIYPTVSGTYSVEVTRCGVMEPDEINIVIAGLPTPSITQSGNELVASAADNYQWYKEGVLIPGATNNRYKPRGYGRYKVAVTSADTGCSGESPEYFFMPEGGIFIGDIRVKVSPNPGNGLAKLIFSKLPPGPVQVTVFDRVGRRILVTTMSNTVNDINLTPYAKGVYFVECVLGDKRIIIPVVTQ
ncbi:MAG: PKD domain-containing protein [Chitinophagaceae bacterium]|nr:PKD domain-containing protein [Chitinophagaceae bacterium]